MSKAIEVYSGLKIEAFERQFGKAMVAELKTMVGRGGPMGAVRGGYNKIEWLLKDKFLVPPAGCGLRPQLP